MPRRRSAARSWERQRGAKGDAEELGAGRSGRAGRGDVRRGDVGCGAPDRSRPGAGGRHRQGGEGRALGDGLRGWDPDLSGAVGWLAVSRDQPGPRCLHQPARQRGRGRLRRCALSGGRQAGGAALWHGPGLPRSARGLEGAGRAPAQPQPAPARLRRRRARPHRPPRQRLHVQDGAGAQGAPAQDGRWRDRRSRDR
jgi:hypothetical protein